MNTNFSPSNKSMVIYEFIILMLPLEIRKHFYWPGREIEREREKERETETDRQTDRQIDR